MKNKAPNYAVRDRAMELAVATAGHGFPQLSALRNASARVHRIASKAAEYSIALLDITLDIAGELRLIETNGSNAALSSLTAAGDVARAAHMAASFESRTVSHPEGVALLGHQPGFLHIPEFFGRAGRFTEFLSEHRPTALRGPGEPLGDEIVTVVAGPLDALAKHCEERAGALFFRNRPVVFASNTNLLPELARQGRIRFQNGHADMNTEFFHEGRLVPLIHDKSAQQRIAKKTGIEPLIHADGWSPEDCAARLESFRRAGHTAVLKMNGGSGGSGIEFFSSRLSREETAGRWEALVRSAVKKYGDGVQQTMFPVRLFQFAQSTPYSLHGANHLWDLRVQCLISPGVIEVSPAVVRLCPEPFVPSIYSRDSVVSNLSGRKPSTQFMRSPWQTADAGTGTVLDACGFTPAGYDQLINACAAWCEAALIPGEF